ncbi:MAG: hypothetical protein AB1627_06835, partial [Chloroflexota bacterium]
MAYYPNYLGGKVRAADAQGAKASLKFTGAAVSWIGPVGPTRGKAKVYIDNDLVTTVNTWASSFRPTRVLFKRSWDTVGTHRITIVTSGTDGHPTVALDAFLVRLDTGVEVDPVDDAGQPIGTTPPEESAAPSEPPAPTVAPTESPAPTLAPAPTPAPSATPAPAPTATPAPAPTATPAPAPTATPAPAPTATPPSGTTYAAVFSGDATGATDVTSALRSFLQSHNGQRVALATNGVYKVT